MQPLYLVANIPICSRASNLFYWLFYLVNIAMTTRLTKALEFANYRITLNNQLAVLKAKTQSLLSYSTNGGTFSIDPALITFCKQMLDQDTTDIVLLDIYQNPIRVSLSEFVDEITSRYFEVTNDYHAEYEKLKKARQVSKILDLGLDEQ